MENVESQQPLNVYLCGGHSTGKTTLQETVARATSLTPVAEVARTVIARLGVSREEFHPKNHPGVFENLQVEIVMEHARLESANLSQGIGETTDNLHYPIYMYICGYFKC